MKYLSNAIRRVNLTPPNSSQMVGSEKLRETAEEAEVYAGFLMGISIDLFGKNSSFTLYF